MWEAVLKRRFAPALVRRQLADLRHARGRPVGLNRSSDQLTVGYSGAVDSVLRDVDASHGPIFLDILYDVAIESGVDSARWSRSRLRYRQLLGGS